MSTGDKEVKATAVLESMNLRENPFTKNEPDDLAIEQVFVGRAPEMRDAALRLVDRPRNLLVQGGYGYGKTTFVKKLLHELSSSKKLRFLTGYAPLRHDSSEGFQLAALAALAEAARRESPDSPLCKFGTGTLSELSRIEGDGLTARMPDLRFRDGLALAKEAGFHRVVIAVDEIDKRDARAVLDILMGCRFFLDLEASFVLTGRPMDVLGDARSSLLAAFDHRVLLQPFTQDESTEIIRRNLASARRAEEAEPTLRPFENGVVEAMVARAQGLPRPLNLMAYAALEETIRDAVEEQGGSTVTSAHLSAALEREGNVVASEIGAEGRLLLDEIFRRSGYVSGADLGGLVAGGLFQAVGKLEELVRQDALLRLEAADGAAFSLSPTVTRKLEVLRAERDKLRALWDDAVKSTEKQARGRALEDFAVALFGEAFQVVEKNLRTDAEEIDLVLAPTQMTDARFRKNLHVFVECKNWSTEKVDQKVISALAGKLASHRFTQGFVLATGLFTDDARRQAENLAMSSGVEVILLDGPLMRSFLDHVRPVSDLLVEQHSRLLLRRR